jgi:hypothetical protein
MLLNKDGMYGCLSPAANERMNEMRACDGAGEKKMHIMPHYVKGFLPDKMEGEVRTCQFC